MVVVEFGEEYGFVNFCGEVIECYCEFVLVFFDLLMVWFGFS